MKSKKALQKRLAELEKALSQLQEKVKDEKWLDAYEVKKLLNISDSTLWRYRKEEKIPYRIIGNKYFFPSSFFTKSVETKIFNAHLL